MRSPLSSPEGSSEPSAGLLPRLGVVTAAVLFSSGGAVIKATELSVWQIAGLRCGLAFAVLALAMPRALSRIRPRMLLVGLAFAATMVLYVASNKNTTAASAIFLQATAPLWVMLLGPRLLGERVRRSDLLWMALLALGLAAFLGDRSSPAASAPNPPLGNLLAAVAGLTWALTVMGLRWVGRASGTSSRGAGSTGGTGGTGGAGGADDSAAAALCGTVLAFLFCLPFLSPAWAPGRAAGSLPLAALDGSDLLVIAYLGIVQVGLAYVFLTRALPQVPAFEASLLLLAEPVAAPLWAWLAHDEVPSAWAVAGGALILLATLGRTLARQLSSPSRARP